MSLAIPAEATRTVVCAAPGEAVRPSAATSASNRGTRLVINDLLALALDMTFATVWYVGARVNAADRPQSKPSRSDEQHAEPGPSRCERPFERARARRP